MTVIETSTAKLDLSIEHLGPRLAAFLQARWGRPVELTNWQRFPAGFSWVTIGFSAAAAGTPGSQALILRIGDPRGLLAPYKAAPEAVLLQALAGVPGLPVPAVHAHCDDPGVIGAPFLVTGRVSGDTPMPWKGDAELRDPAQNELLARDFVQAIAALHRFAWRSTALAPTWGAARAEDVAQTQVRQWAAHAGLARGTAAAPQLYYAWRWLERHAPLADHVTVVHGDYRVGNFLQQRGRITAVLDWELAHPGDPHEDLAWAGLRIFAAGTSRIGGLFDRAAFMAGYQTLTGFTLRPERIRYYEILGLFKCAAMLVSATQRVASGRARDIRMGSMGFQLASTLLELNRLLAEGA